MSFQLDELLRGAGTLDELVQQLLGIEAEARRVQEGLEPFLYDSYDTGSNALNAVAQGQSEVGKVRQELVEVSRSVRASHRDYLLAEARNALPHALAFDQYRLSGANGLLALGRDLTEEGYNRLIPVGYQVSDVLQTFLDSPLLATYQPRPISIEKMEETAEDVQPSMAESLRRLERLHARNDGEIEVIRFDKNGSASWMVLIPGTQPDSPTTNPFDIQGIGEALGYDSEEVVPAVGDALREAGASAGDQVVAVGHSQGGVHAMNLSQDKAFLSEFDLKYVLTAGAPVGSITAESGISSLHLEHVQDWVPGADGRVNADTKDRVTVTLSNEVKPPEGEDPGIGPGHDQENYAAGAQLVEASSDESLAASTAVFAGVVGAGGVAKVTRFKLERAPLPVQASVIRPAAPPSSGYEGLSRNKVKP
ncbi:hypothetical protein ACLRGI_12865 [Paenarthrobacter nitroguajacolicus]|uniref:hypothetical protein n=1 Tax=Paenarthrobacter nitroguajacolicus TaxID=211146 RepID=UPI003AE388B8